jgi:cytoskeletal protein RodZ
MYRASTLLQNARIDRDLSLEEVSKKLRVPLKYLQSLENEVVNCFPQEPYCSLIVKDYAEFLGLNSSQILSLFRRDFAQKRKTKTKSKNFLSFTPQFTFYILLALTIMAFSSYLLYEYVQYNQPPKLLVSWPASSQISDDAVDLTGVTDPEATVRINQDLVIVDQEGAFQKKLNLPATPLEIIVESRSPSGKTTTLQKTLTRSPPPQPSP